MSGAAFRVRVTRIHLRSNRESGGYGGAVQTQASRLSIGMHRSEAEGTSPKATRRALKRVRVGFAIERIRRKPH